VPRLMPGQVLALFHGVTRTSHAVRALDRADTRARRAELARALGNWACWCRPGEPTDQRKGPLDDPGSETAFVAARAAGCYVTEPNAFTLHGVTGARAVHLLSEYLDTPDATAALFQLEAEHRALYRDVTPACDGDANDRWGSDPAQKGRGQLRSPSSQTR
jgi:hypothetical protein